MTGPTQEPSSGAQTPTERGSAGTWAHFDAQLDRVAAGGDAGAAEGVEAGASAATILLTGESGSGKSRAARAIHDRSPRSAGPFVPVHLAGLATTLLEAELFGHVEGAFTGAHRAREGRFVRASEGTIVLEAVETLDKALQVKLLRVLQERVVEPLGAESTVPVDVRVIATTARDLRQAVEDGTFRDDLYYRLAVVPLTVPPLRSRRQEPDFEALLARVLASVAARIGVDARPLTPAALEALGAHPWPGNFRELENAFERVLVLGAPGEPVAADEFAFLDDGLKGRAAEIASQALSAGVTLDALDAALIDGALAQERGNISAAARAIGLSRRAFDYRRKKLQSADDQESGD